MDTFKSPFAPAPRLKRKRNDTTLEQFLLLDIPELERITLVELNHFHKNYLAQKHDLSLLPTAQLRYSPQAIILKTILNDTHLRQISKYILSTPYPPRRLYLLFRKFRLELTHFYDPLKTNLLLQHHLQIHENMFPKQSCHNQKSL
jgi:hypothetical protein